MNLNHKRGRKSLSILLVMCMMLSTVSTAFAAWNSGSGSFGGGTGSAPSAAAVNYKNQGLKVSLYFCPMSGVVMDGTEASRAAMDKRWVQGTGIKKIGDSVYVGRDGANFGSAYYKGNIAASDLFLNLDVKEQYRVRELIVGAPPYAFGASSIGMNSPNFPVIITEGMGPGQSTTDYFMTANPNYEQGKTAQFLTNANMRALIRAIAGSNGYGKDDIIFSNSEGGAGESDFDSGTYKGDIGEYKLFLESCINIGGTTMTVRDAVTKGFVEGKNAAARKNYQASTMRSLANGLFLVANDTFGMTPKGANITTTTNLMNLASNPKAGYGVSILSSELFRNPKTRSVASHVNVFLTDGDAIGMEYIGTKVDTTAVSQKIQEIILNNAKSYSSGTMGILFPPLDLANTAAITMKTSMEVKAYLASIGIDVDVTQLVDKALSDAMLGATSSDSMTMIQAQIDQALIESGNIAPLSVITSKSLAALGQNVDGGLEENSLIAISQKDIAESKPKQKQGTILVDKDKTTEFNAKQSEYETKILELGWVKNIAEASGYLAPESKELLEKNGQLQVDDKWASKLEEIDNMPTQIPVVMGENMFTLYNNNVEGATIPKGMVKDIATGLLQVIGTEVKDQMLEGKEILYKGGSSSTFIDTDNAKVKIGNPINVENRVFAWLGGIDDGIQVSEDPNDGVEHELNVNEIAELDTTRGELKTLFPMKVAEFQEKNGGVYTGFGNVDGTYKYPVVSIGNSNDAAYGVKSSDGDIKAINIESLGINHALEAGLVVAPKAGFRIMKPSSFESYTSGTRSIRANMTGTNIKPARWVPTIEEDSTKDGLAAQSAVKGVTESMNYEKSNMNRVMDPSILSTESSAKIAKSIPNGIQTGTDVQAFSNAMLNSVLPKDPSEIGDKNYSRMQIKGNYGVSYAFYDTAIPVDIVFMTKTKDGKLVFISNDEKTSTIVGAYNITSGIEKALAISEEYKLPGKSGETPITIKPTEVIVKPAEAGLFDFAKKFTEARAAGQVAVEWPISGGLTTISKIAKAPYSIKVNEDYRALQYAGVDNTIGAPTVVSADGTIKGAISVVASEQDKEAYLADPVNNRMALIVVLETSSSINQYNVIDVIDKDGNKTTTVQPVPPKYSDDEKSVILEPSIDGANQTEWKTSTEDKQPQKWEDVTPLPPVKESNTPTESIPQTKDESDTIYVHYVKTANPEEIKSDLYLPERRISWLKSLKDIGGVPTISFTWPAITGSEEHYCGSKHCSGHTCTEGTGSDTFFRFVCSNTTAVASQIMGNKVGFMPYDVNNVFEMNRGKSGGTKTMNPDYGFVIWRGKDIPTIASYKYGDVTGDGKAPGAPIIKSLIGEAQTGIKQVGNREASYNNKFYMDSFTITEGKSNYDTGNLREFLNEFGGNQSTADGQFEGILSQFHDVSTKYKIAVGEAEVAKDRMDEDKTYLDSTHETHDSKRSSHDRGEYRNCSTCREVQGIYDASKKNYDDKVAVRDGLKVTYDALAAKLGQTKTNAIEKHVGDYDYNTHWSYCGKESWGTASGNSQTFNPQVRVDVGFGTANTGDKKVAFKSTNLNAFGKEYKNVVGFPINNTKTINFWPYVNMVYDTTMGQVDQNVYVLGGHESKFLPQDYVEIGYLPVSANSETTTGLVLQSKQWSTHQSAIKLAGGVKNKVLPGGAIYRLTTPGAGTGSSTATTIAVSSWLTFLPSDTINATTAGKDIYNGTSQNNKNEGLYRQVLNSLNSLDVVQVVGGTQVLQELAGSQKVSGTSGQPTSKDAKYWLKQNIKDGTGNASVPASNDAAIKINSVKPNEADLDVTNTKEERMYYRIYSNTNGEVFVSKSKTSAADTAPGKGTVIGKITKAQGLADLLKVDEVKALNNRTNVVENYLNSIDRNIGNDKELAAKGQDAKWYNEAFDGICVVRINKQIEVGFKDGNMAQAARTAALDTKLEPVRKSQADLFKSKVDSWFETDKHTNLSDEAGYVGTFTNKESGAPDTKITIQNMNGIYKSKVFLIPNASVTDLY